ncbi:IPT/TIG domain-containing protein [Rhodohalobacter sp. 614A]|uniref:IPT/TIG domain-containing protein n=1 Tax=Rhodohalobacter sp. 614A TaxID=2908649 RepID=UPI001F2F493B|nr:IPT/TIG domain-containing protein [Rhodohalobacter sp. 614A]
MKRSKYIANPFYLLAAVLFGIAGCNSSNSDSPPQITSVSPESGGIGTSVTITGTGFSSMSSENMVEFNGTSAMVTSADSEELQTTVPEGATSGPIEVSVNGQSATGPVFSVDNRLNFTGEFENEEYDMMLVQISNGNTADTTITIPTTSEIEIELVNGSMDEIELDIEDFLEDGLNFFFGAVNNPNVISFTVEDDAIAEVSGSEFELEDTDISIFGSGDTILGELTGEGEFVDGNVLFTFEYVLITGNLQLTFSGEVEWIKQ